MVNRGAQAPTQNSGEVVDAAGLDLAVATVHQNASKWHELPIRKKVQILDEILLDTIEVSGEWTRAACEHKGLNSEGPEYGEELFAGVGTFVRMVRTLRDSLEDLDRTGRPRYPGPVRSHSNNRIGIGVAPATLFDRILYLGMSAEVWMKPGVSEEQVQSGQAVAYREGGSLPAVCLVLGAGNVASLAPRDALSQLFEENRTVLIKANPVNEYLVPFWDRAMRALAAPGYLRIVKGGGATGAYLTEHDHISAIHITGSDKTYEAIVFGAGAEGAKNKAANQRITTKEISAELGCVTPIILMPGKWSEKELRYQARHLATMFTNNDGFNCLTPRVLIMHQEWPQRERFMKYFATQLEELPTRRAYYPGAWNRQAQFVDGAKKVQKFGDESDGKMAWTLLPEVEAGDVENMAFNQEAWCSVMAQTSLSAPSPEEFAVVATKFCNEVLWGTLSSNIIIDPRSLKKMSAVVEEMVGALEYGTVGLNAWSAASLALSTPVWGAYPGHQANDIQSGTGFVGNAYMFSTAQKTVLRGRFRPLLTPSWFAGGKNGREVMERFVAFEAAPSWLKIPSLLRSALKG